MFPLYLVCYFMIGYEGYVRLFLLLVGNNDYFFIFRYARLFRVNVRKIGDVSESAIMQVEIHPNIDRHHVIG